MRHQPNDEGKRALTARGFGSFRRWAKENRRAAADLRKGKPELARMLDDEYDRLIAPNLHG